MKKSDSWSKLMTLKLPPPPELQYEQDLIEQPQKKNNTPTNQTGRFSFSVSRSLDAQQSCIRSIKGNIA